MADINHLKPQDDKEPEDGARSRRLASHWLKQYELCERDLAEWHKDGADVTKRYRDQRGKADREVHAGRRRFNALWGWYETIKPAVFGKTPVANVERRFTDHDPIGRTSSQILERALRNEFEINGFDAAIKRAVQDYLLPGRGQVWVRYEPQFEESTSIPPLGQTDFKDGLGLIEDTSETDEEEKLQSTGEELITESAPIDYINWKDFKTYPDNARTWKDVEAVSKDLYLSKEQCIKRFGDKVGNHLQQLTEDPQQVGSNDLIRQERDMHQDKIKVVEIWDKQTEKVYWVSPGYPYLCDETDDPLKLTGFFPCPEPLSSILTSDTLIPVPFYHEWKDQAEEIDTLTQRISQLAKACKVTGIYDASIKASLDRVLKESNENTLIPVDGFTQYGDKGLEGSIFFLPIEIIAQTLVQLIEVRKQVMQDLDLLTGISDIMRGTSDARETMGAQRLKANAAGTRVDEQRREVGRFVRDAVRLIAEVIAKHFSEKTLAQASGIFYEEDIPNKIGMFFLEKLAVNLGEDEESEDSESPPIQAPQQPPGLPAPGQPPQAMGAPATPPRALPPAPPPNPIVLQFQKAQKAAIKVKKAIDLLRDDIPRGYRIDIEVDTLVAGDQMQERQDATEFIQGITTYLKEVAPIVQAQPLMAPLAAKMLQWGVRKFRTGRDLESTIDEFADQIIKQAQQPHPPQPNPEQIKAQVEIQKSQAEIAKAKLDAQSQQANDQREAALNQQQMQQELMKLRMEMQKMQMDMQEAKQEHIMKMQELQVTHSQKIQQANMNHQQAMQSAMQPTPMTSFGPQ